MTLAFRRVSRPLPAVLLLLGGLHAERAAPAEIAQAPRVHAPARAALPLDFIENRGQWPERVAFVARKGRVAAAFRANAIDLQFGHAAAASLTLVFEGALATVSLAGERQRTAHYNFYMGSNPERWRSQVPVYESLLYHGLYAGGDLRVREQDGRLEYDLLLEPGADLGQVVIRAGGASGLHLAADGSLVIDTAAGPLRQAPPTTWEVLPGGDRRPVECRFRIIDGSRYGFIAPGRDRSLALVVDPGLEWGTFLGGFGSDPISAVAAARDGTGDILVAGMSNSPDFPSIDDPTLGPMQNRVFVARLNASGSALVYATFLGGWHSQILYRGLATNAAGEAVIAGESRSPDFPTTPGAFSRTFLNGDAFVAKVDPLGALRFSTFVGGSGADDAYAVDFDPEGSVIVGGNTTSADFPTTAGAFDTTYNAPNAPSQGGFHGDMYVARLSADGSQLTYATFLGGPSVDVLEDLVVDPLGFVTVVGWVTGNTEQVFVTTPGAFDATWNGSQDAALARLKLDGQGSSDLRYATLLGGTSQDNIFGIAVDPANPELVTVAGRTWSWDFPTTPGVLKPTNPRGSDLFPDVEDAFVTRFRFPAAGSGSLLWSTYLGAPQNVEQDAASDVAIGNAGEAIVVGRTGALDFPTTRGAFDRTTVGVFASRLSADGARLLYSTLFGGTAGNIDSERISPRVAHAGGNTAVIAGATESTDFPTTVGAFDRTFNSEEAGASDGYLIKLALDADESGDLAAEPPVLLHPSDGGTFPFGTYFARLEWAEVADTSGVEAYQYQLQTSPAFPEEVVRTHYSGSVRTTHVMLPPLPDAGLALATWYWRVRTADRAGNFSAWSAPRSFTVSSTAGGFSISLVGIDPLTVVGGNSATGIVYFTAPAPEGAAPVKLSVHKSRLQAFIGTRPMPTVPATVSIPAGATQVRFPIATPQVSVSTPVDIFATLDGIGRLGGFTVNPPAAVSAKSISVSPIFVTGGTSVTGTLTLSGPAPAGGATFPLTSTHPQAATVPSTVTVPEGAASATFPITTRPVTVAIDAQIAATPPGIWLPAVLKVRPSAAVTLTSLVLNASSVAAGTQVTATLGFSGPVPPTPWPASPDAIIALSSSDPRLVGLPSMVFVAAGTTGTSFSFFPTSPPATTTVAIRAAFDSTTLSAPLTIASGGPATVASIALPESTIQGGFGGIGRVHLAAAAPTGGVVVSLSNSHPAVLSMPATVSIGAGSTTGSFAYTTTTVATATAVTASASYGSSSASTSVTINPPTARSPLASITVSPATVTGGSSATGTATLQNPARAGGVIVQLGTSNTSVATVPSSITVPEGAVSATFVVTTAQVATTTGIVISGLGDNTGLPQTTGLTLTPGSSTTATLSAVSLNPTSVVGGNSSTGTVTLSAAAPSGGAAVSLADNSPAATTPASVTVPAGSTSASVTVTTSAVTASTAVTISAVYAGVTRTATLTVTPSTATPSAPSLVSPSNGATVAQPVTLDWSDVTNAASYEVQVDTSSTIAAPFTANPTVTASQVTLSGLPAQRLWWRVRARNAAGVFGPFSSTRRFTPQAASATATLSSVGVNPASVVGGTGSTGTVTLTSAAPTGGAVVALASSNTGAAGVPASVTVAAGATSATFPATTSAVGASTPVTITAEYNGVTRTATLTVNPPSQAATLTVTATGRSGERVTSNPAGIDVSVGSTGSASFAVGTSITLSVTNGRDAVWSGACSSGSDKTKTCTFTLNGNASVTANVQ